MDIWVLILIIGALFLLFGGKTAEEKEIANRLKELSKENKKKTAMELLEEEQLNRSFFDRIIQPILKSFGESASKRTSKAKREELKKMLAMAGNPGNMTLGEFIALQRIVMLLAPLFAFIVTTALKLQFLHVLMSIMIGVILAILLPRLVLQRKAAARQLGIQRKLPDVLDLLTVSVEAGLGFDQALQKVVEKFKGPIAEEFEIVLREARLGKPRKDALKGMADKMEVDDLSNFISAIIQAEHLGVSIGNVLRIQSSQARQKRRQRAEEAAMKAPIKMMLPLVGCIFPTIMIVIMGPAAFRFYMNLGAK